MMSKGSWRTAVILVVGVVLPLSVPALSKAETTRTPVDLGALTKEIMSLKVEDKLTQLAMWLPGEFFVEAALTDSSVTRDQAEKDLDFLKAYHTIAVESGQEQPDGSTIYESEKQIRARSVLRTADGREVRPIDKPPPKVSATVSAIKAVIAGGADTAGMYLLVFPAATQDGKLLVDASKRGKLTLVLKSDAHMKES